MKNRRKGFTLAEITIVLAVVAIISVVVVTFTMNIGQRSSVGNSKLDALNEINMAKTILTAWAGNVTDFNIDDNGNISGTIDGNTVNVMRKYRVLQAEVSDEETLQCPAETIRSVKFAKQESGDRYMIFCTITYTIERATPKGAEDVLETTTFCIYASN